MNPLCRGVIISSLIISTTNADGKKKGGESIPSSVSWHIYWHMAHILANAQAEDLYQACYSFRIETTQDDVTHVFQNEFKIEASFGEVQWLLLQANDASSQPLGSTTGLSGAIICYCGESSM